ncbi:hypothetical protein Tco_0960151 [Tanacetum coccineum]
MASMKYCDKHNQVGFLKKPKESTGFAEITVTASTLADGTLELRATIDTLEYTIIEASVQSKLQLPDASGISMLPNTETFKGMSNMGYPTNGQVDQAGTQSQPSFSTVPPPPTSQPAPTESTTIPLLVVAVDQGARQAYQVVIQPSLSEPLPSSSPPPMISATTESEPTPVVESTTNPNLLSLEPDNEPIEPTFEQPSSEHQPLSPR